MLHVTLSHIIDCDEETFWNDVFFNQALHEGLFLGELGLLEYSVISLEETENETFRRVSALPKIDIPGALKKAIGDSLRFTEETRFDKVTKVAKVTVFPEAARVPNEGTIRVRTVAPGKIERIVEIRLEAKAGLFGTLIERKVEKGLREGYTRAASFINRWLAEKNAVEAA